jgi:hypothetical protein
MSSVALHHADEDLPPSNPMLTTDLLRRRIPG